MTPRAWLVLGGVVGAQGSALGQDVPPRIAVGTEVLEGVRLEQGLVVFRGVPYAAPPIGELRWKPPAPYRAGTGSRPAREFGPACPQSERLSLWTRSIAAAFGTQDKLVTRPLVTNEDCLYLNVWTPALGERAHRRPVMVWIHGGSNLNGEGHTSWYDGLALARRGVVVVTINYRLGGLGFLAHPALTAESPNHSSGNYGLLDQLEALRWVQRNVAAFGGDPGRVTVFGESAGSIDILHLMVSPLAKGLFHRAIAESGAPMGATQRLGQAEAAGQQLESGLGIGSGDALAAMRARPAADILAGIDRLLLAGKYIPGPNVDGWVLPDVTGRAFAEGTLLRVPLLIGSNAREMTTLRIYLPRVERTPEAYGAWLTATVGPAAERVRALYPATTAGDVEGAVIDLTTDLYFTCPSRFAARSVSKGGSPVYLYWFTRIRPAGQALGAYHGAEINYVFGTQEAWLPRDTTDDTLADAMQRYWVAFASDGRPAVSGLPEWPAYTQAADQHLQLGPTIAVGSGLKREACDLTEPGFRMQWGQP